MKKVKRILCFLLLWFFTHAIAVTIDGVFTQPKKSEYAVIFGNTVNADGSLSKRLKARVDKGLELYRDSLVQKLFLSGGLGVEGHYEAQKMADYLLMMGVPETDLIIDDLGDNSWLTTTNFKKMFPEANSIIVVSQFYHLSRAKLTFRKLDFKNVSAASPDYYEIRDFYSLFREFFGYYKYLLLY